MKFTIGTLVTDWSLYQEMRNTFTNNGFDDDCEYIVIDNTQSNRLDAYQGLNDILSKARGDYVILCHQDVTLDTHDRQDLEKIIADLEAIDGNWAVAGNAGFSSYRRMHACITDKFGHFDSPDLPQKVHSLDENFMILKAKAGVRFSRDVSGFHLYGTDICLIAEIMGYSSYVIGFHLEHHGSAHKGPAFDHSLKSFVAKWNRALRDRPVQSPSASLYLSGSGNPLRDRIAFRYLRALSRYKAFQK